MSQFSCAACRFKFIAKALILSLNDLFRYFSGRLISSSNVIKNKKVAIYTSLYGGYDAMPRLCRQSTNVDYYCFSDRIDNSSSRWKYIVSAWEDKFDSPAAAAKWFKINSHLIPELSSYDYTIYVDASAVVVSRNFVNDALLVTDEIGFFAHSTRNSIIEEALISQEMNKYRSKNLLALARSYVKEIGSDNLLLAGGVIVRKKEVSSFNNHWWSLIENSLQDQISLPLALHRSKQVFSVLPGSIFNNRYLLFYVCHRLYGYEASPK